MTIEEKRRERMSTAETRMRGSLLSVILPVGMLAGLDTVRDCMKDETIRAFLGHTLLHEIMPCLGEHRDILDPVAMAVCKELEEPAVIQPLALLLQNAVRAWASQVLPILKNYVERDEHLPPCLCMSLAALIMLFAGTRQEDDGRYTILKNGERCFVSEDEEILASFSRLSCDMPPESLAYAALSDRAIWDEDLREISGLEDLIADQLRDLQLLGLLDALAKAWKNHE
ncbi:MAG: hypothetical protein IKH30_02700 [Clostridia bacterium]|nr:hypothetical protein [Clostridia bacterium]